MTTTAPVLMRARRILLPVTLTRLGLEDFSRKAVYTVKVLNKRELRSSRSQKSIMGAYSAGLPKKRTLPKLMACMTKTSLETFRSRALFNLAFLDNNGVRRRKLPLYECLILELRESGYADAAAYLQDLIYDNAQLVKDDDIGIVIDLRKREDYLEHIKEMLQKAEKEHEEDHPKKECMHLLNLALHYAEKEKGILWLAEKFFQAAIAVSSQYLVDGGRLKAVCKYYFGKFLLDKFPGADPEEPFMVLTEVRDSAIGKDWLLYEAEDNDEEVPSDTVFKATALQLLRVLLNKARLVRKSDTPKAERLARLAERRAKDAGAIHKTAEAIIEIGICQLMMNNLNNAQKTLERAFKIHEETNNIEGLCEVRMHMAAVMQRLGEHEAAAKLLTEMGASAMEHGLRRHLGRALHLLGELHLRRERPELGTQHLAEAFLCFMGFRFESVQGANIEDVDVMKETQEDIGAIYGDTKEIFEEEAEQSRLMTAISAGQELMASYFNLLKEAGGCSVAKMKTIEWKLSHSGWWIHRKVHDFLPCICPVHNRTPLDVLWAQLAARESNVQMSTYELGLGLSRASTIHDIRNLHTSSFGRSKFSSIST